MIIFPAIDLKNGKCVRLLQGQKNMETIYFDNPVEVAKMWESKGASYLHLVDLDGAFDGEPKNLSVIQEIVETLKIPVELGGGIRNLEIAKAYIDSGVARIIIGTQAVKNLHFIEQLLSLYDDKVCVSIDAKNGIVCTEGWVENSNIESIELASKLESLGLSTLVYTDISKDGMMTGPNFEILDVLNNHLKMNIIASGGVSSVSDINRLEKMGLYGTITGKALYEGTIDLEKLLKEDPKLC
jgi:phosphoribosylformimino-5-aminoimidazole carboxamide ribotide isomerase